MRRIINDDILAGMVQEQLQLQTTNGASFTAHDITRAIRRGWPDLEILHNPVRGMVHNYMSSLVAAGLYAANVVRISGASAIMYEPTIIIAASPAHARTTSDHPTIPLLPLN